MHLDELQLSLQSLYEVETEHQVTNFLTSENSQYSYLQEAHFSSMETVFLHQDDDALDIAVYLDKRVLASIEEEGSHPEFLNHLCYALEGISHFLYIVHNGRFDRSVTKLEMELQAEVDKFIYLFLFYKMQRPDMHRALFEDISFRSELNPEEHERYRTANALAEKYCFYLLKNFTLTRDSSKLRQELCRFYRYNLQEKVYRINQIH